MGTFIFFNNHVTGCWSHESWDQQPDVTTGENNKK